MVRCAGGDAVSGAIFNGALISISGGGSDGDVLEYPPAQDQGRRAAGARFTGRWGRWGSGAGREFGPNEAKGGEG